MSAARLIYRRGERYLVSVKGRRLEIFRASSPGSRRGLMIRRLIAPTSKIAKR